MDEGLSFGWPIYSVFDQVKSFDGEIEAGFFLGSETALTNLNYSSITNPPDLALYNGWTNISGIIFMIQEHLEK